MKKLLVLFLCLCLLLPCAFSEQNYENKRYTDEEGNQITVYYNTDYETWCQQTLYAKPNEEGFFILEDKKMDGDVFAALWYSDYENRVLSRSYSYNENGILSLVIYYHEDGSEAAEVYDENGAVLYKDVIYAEPNAEGYEVSQRFLPDGTLDHEWWWGPDDLYHEIWYVDGQVESYTYWWYNVDGHDVRYEEHHKEYSKYRYYDYDTNGELQMSESETVLH